MQVWRLKGGGIPPAISKVIATAEKDAEFHRLIREAESLIADINILLGVAAKSSDYTTKKARLEAGAFKLGLLKLINLNEPRITITNIQQVDTDIAVIRKELASMNAQVADPFEVRSPEFVFRREVDSRDQQRIFIKLVADLRRIIDESLMIALNSKVRDTQLSRIGVARNKLTELAAIAESHSEICDFNIEEYELAVCKAEQIIYGVSNESMEEVCSKCKNEL